MYFHRSSFGFNFKKKSFHSVIGRMSKRFLFNFFLRSSLPKLPLKLPLSSISKRIADSIIGYAPSPGKDQAVPPFRTRTPRNTALPETSEMNASQFGKPSPLT